MKRLVHLICLITALWCGFLATGCGGKGGTQGEAADSLEMRLHDTIVVGTLYSPTSYFIYRGDPMGYHYDIIQKFAKDNHVHIQFKTVRNMAALLSLLDSAKIDIIAYNIPMTAEFKKRVRHCVFANIDHQLLLLFRAEQTPPFQRFRHSKPATRRNFHIRQSFQDIRQDNRLGLASACRTGLC